MCEEILHQKLHHHPTKGGKTEDTRFNDWYSRTLASYQQFFGAIPPADIWPASQLRFGEAPYFKRINTRNVWMIPKPKLSAGITSALLICILSGILAGCSSNPVATGIFVFAAITSLIIVAIVWIVKAAKKSSVSKNNKRGDSATTSSDSSSHSSDFSSGAAATGVAAGFAGFGGGDFGGSGAGGDYGSSGDSSNSDGSGDSSSDVGGDSGGSGCSSGCGGGGD